MQALQRGIVAVDQEEAVAVATLSESYAISPSQLLAKLDDLFQRYLCARIARTVSLVCLAEALAEREGDELGY